MIETREGQIRELEERRDREETCAGEETLIEATGKNTTKSQGVPVPGSAVGIMEEPLSESKTAEVADGTTVSKGREVGGAGGCSAQQSEGEMFRNSRTLSKVLPLPRSVSSGVTVTGEKNAICQRMWRFLRKVW